MGKTASLANIGTIADSSLGFRNRIINGAMTISQAAAGASITPAATGTSSVNFAVDRTRLAYSQNSKLTAQQNRGSVTPPAGLKNYLGVGVASTATVGATDYFLAGQTIEGYNTSDLAWGTASAATVTLSFWVYSNTTGTFGGAVNNSAYDRSYVFSYTINVANTWEQKTVTIAGDTSGTWLTDNSAGIRIWFSLGTGSTLSKASGSWGAGEYYSATGATSLMGNTSNYLYITGVQLEKGSTATSFDYRPYTTELQLAQRYFFKTYAQDVVPGTASSSGAPGRLTDATQNYASIQIFFPVTMRAIPSCVVYNPSTGTTASMRGDASNYAAASTAIGVQNTTVYANNVSIGASASISAHITAAIEL